MSYLISFSLKLTRFILVPHYFQQSSIRAHFDVFLICKEFFQDSPPYRTDITLQLKWNLLLFHCVLRFRCHNFIIYANHSHVFKFSTCLILLSLICSSYLELFSVVNGHTLSSYSWFVLLALPYSKIPANFIVRSVKTVSMYIILR